MLGDINGKSGVNTLDLRDFKKGVMSTDATLSAKVREETYVGSGVKVGDINGKSGVNTLDLRDFKKGVMSTDDTLSARVREYVYVIDK